MRRLVIIITILALPVCAFGAPRITGVTGTVGDNQEIVLGGSGFGANDLSIEWLGGRDGVIERGTDGQPFLSSGRPNWYEDLYPARFDDSRSHSYSKSLILDSSVQQDGRFGLAYDTREDIQLAYVTYYTYFDNQGMTAGQWKMYRTMPVVSVLDRETPQFVMFNKRNFGGASNIAWRPGTASESQTWLLDGALPDAGGWYRIELLLKPSSANGVADGYGRVWVHKPGEYINRVYSADNVLTYGPSDTRKMRVHMFQNYQGNGYGYVAPLGTKVWMDDIYISRSAARIEIGNRSTWDSCTHREIQHPVSWRDEAITFKLNRGSFASGAAVYLYVIDQAGTVNSQGYAVTIGGGGNEDGRPSIEITAPTSNPSYETTNAAVAVSGEVFDDIGISSVTWSNDRGGNGSATYHQAGGTFAIASISLQAGDNLITVTATDSSGQTAHDTLAVRLSDQSAAWSASAQTGDSSWSDSSVRYCVRLLVEKEHLNSYGNTVQLAFQGRQVGSYSIAKVSIAARDANDLVGNVVDSSWTRVTFDGNTDSTWATDLLTVPAGQEKLTDRIPFSIEAGKDYYVTFKINTPSVYLGPPSTYRELYFPSEDRTDDVDWAGNGHGTTQDFHALTKIYVTSETIVPPGKPGRPVIVP